MTISRETIKQIRPNMPYGHRRLRVVLVYLLKDREDLLGRVLDLLPVKMIATRFLQRAVRTIQIAQKEAC